MNSIAFTLSSLEKTATFGRNLGRICLPGDVICLSGDLGAGKTTLSQAIAQGVGVDPSCYVSSPSFAIFHEYPGRIPIYHMDFYRLNNAVEVEDLGLEEYFYLEGITLIEWSERAIEIVPETRLEIILVLGDSECRNATVRWSDELWETRISEVMQSVT